MEIARCGVGLKLAPGFGRYSHLKRHVLTYRGAQKIVRCRGRRGRGTFRVWLSECGGDFGQHGDIFYRPHIHRATARSIASGKKPERETKETDRFGTLEGALASLI